jgi:7-carboxy-7-deazaguanine synthase
MLVVKEMFSTMQGEGSMAGRPAFFVRFAACNLWSGHEKDRIKGAGHCALWCDTAFASGDRHEVPQLVEHIANEIEHWAAPFVVFTGGEPTLQLRKNEQFITRLRGALPGVTLAIETNGTVEWDGLHECIDHVTVSPKAIVRDLSPSQPFITQSDTEHIKVKRGTDLKVVVPSPFLLDELDQWDFEHKFVQPLDIGDSGQAHLQTALNDAARLGWRVSVQTHKLVGLP